MRVGDYGYRYLSPELGRWLNRDPIGEFGGNNLYRMVRNNAPNYIDILGLQTSGTDFAVLAEQIASALQLSNPALGLLMSALQTAQNAQGVVIIWTDTGFRYDEEPPSHYDPDFDGQACNPVAESYQEFSECGPWIGTVGSFDYVSSSTTVFDGMNYANTLFEREETSECRIISCACECNFSLSASAPLFRWKCYETDARLFTRWRQRVRSVWGQNQ